MSKQNETAAKAPVVLAQRLLSLIMETKIKIKPLLLYIFAQCLWFGIIVKTILPFLNETTSVEFKFFFVLLTINLLILFFTSVHSVTLFLKVWIKRALYTFLSFLFSGFLIFLVYFRKIDGQLEIPISKIELHQIQLTLTSIPWLIIDQPKILLFTLTLLILGFWIASIQVSYRFLKRSQLQTLFVIAILGIFLVYSFYFKARPTSIQTTDNNPFKSYLKLDKSHYSYGHPQPSTPLSLTRGQFKGKNLFYFILESTGSKNFFHYNAQQQPDLSRFPWLEQLQHPIYTWSDLSNLFPATTRSHVSIHTGGLIPTYTGMQHLMTQAVFPEHLARSFYEKNYMTSLFTPVHFEFEGLKNIYNKMSFEYKVDPSSLKPFEKESYAYNSWGLMERPFLDYQKFFLAQKQQRPHFSVYLNNNTHHPYTTHALPFWSGAQARHAANVNEIMLHIQDFILFCQSQPHLKNSIIAISGDHGEAFGEIHPQNYLHKNFLYQENVENFLVLIDLSQESAQRTWIQEPNSLADIFPTLSDLFELKTVSTFGQSLLQQPQKINFFHKLSEPEQWGLRDGKWKYIARRFTTSTKTFSPDSIEAELYDLKTDPFEQHNVAAQHPDQVKHYQQLCAEWYWETQNEFQKQIAPKNLAPLLAFDKMTEQGILTFQVVQKNYELEDQTLSKNLKTDERFKLLVQLHPKEKSNQMIVEIVSPSKKGYYFEQTVEPEWGKIWIEPALSLPLENGKWKVTLRFPPYRISRDILVESP
jgi:hypothetical protein